MSTEETRKVVQKWFDALDRGDIETALGCFAEDIEWINFPTVAGVSDLIPWMGTAHGIQEVWEKFSTRDSVTNVKHFNLVDLVVEGSIAVGTVHEISTVLATGLDFEILFATWLKVENGKITQRKSYCDLSPIIYAFTDNVPEKLLEAVKANDVSQVETLLIRHRGDANGRDPKTGLTLLMMAACQANLAMVQLLLNAGADVFTADPKTGATALHKACQGGNVEIAGLLLDAGAHLDAITPTMGHTPIMDALWYKWPELVKLLVDRGQNLYFDTHYGFKLDDHITFELNLNHGEEKQKFERIKDLIEAEKARHQSQIASQTVMGATNQGDLEAVKQLIASGAEVNTVYPHMNSFTDGHTPLLVAARDGHTDIVRELLAAGAKVQVVDWVFKGSPIHKATYNGNTEILKILIEHPDIDLNVQGAINGYTPLHDALWHGFSECAEILVNAGACLHLKGHDGKTVLDLAREFCGEGAEITRLIRKKLDSAQ